MRYGFKKAERICSRIEVENLFRHGRHFSSGVLRFRVLELEDVDEWPKAKFLVVVPKRAIRRAVNRNLIKRRIREVIRLNKFDLINGISKGSNKRLLIAVLYTGSEIPDYRSLERSFLDWINKNWP